MESYGSGTSIPWASKASMAPTGSLATSRMTPSQSCAMAQAMSLCSLKSPPPPIPGIGKSITPSQPPGKA
eukprot:6391390-Amphidinium_carterae.2